MSEIPTQKERPILFNAPMVRAILEGRKTQTRRIEKAFPAGRGFVQKLSNDSWEWSPDGGFDQGIIRARCPYGQPGDRLWVRETFARCHPGLLQKLDPDPDSAHWFNLYKADGVTSNYIADYGRRWTSSIHMPRWASRITLEITGVRVERLQEITEDEADKDEGMSTLPASDWGVTWWETFARYWDDINGVGGAWDKNPWVWVIDFLSCADGKGMKAPGIPK